ncbi:MAG: nucleotide pyrophosphohydrolase [bacterium]
MPFSKAQVQVDSWVKNTGPGYWKPHEVLATLVEEVGELAREINHQFGPKKKKKSEPVNELSSEIADVFFVLICLANSLNIDIDDAFSKQMEKVSTRDKDRWRK